MPLSENNTTADPDFIGLKHRSVDGAVATAASQGVKFLLSFVSQIWLARLISPAEYGLVAMVAPILGFIGIISDLGIGTALVQQKSISQSQISSLFWLNGALSLAVSLGLIAISPAVGLLYHEPKTIAITMAMAAMFFVGSLGIYPAAILTREMRLVARAVIECIAAFVGLVVGVLTAKAGWGYWSLIYLQAAATVTGLLLTWWFARWMPSRPLWDRSVGHIMRFGSSLTVSNIAVYFSMSADNMIVGAVKGKVALGLYDKAYRLVAVQLLQLSAPIGRVAIPLLSRLLGDPPRYASAFRRMVQLPNLISIPALICGMFLSPQIVHVFLGPTWSGISPVFSWVCVGGLASSLYGSASWLFTSQGRGRDQMKWSVITSLISIASFVIGIRWGAVGVASVAGVGFVAVQTPLIVMAATKTGPVSTRFVIDAMAPVVFSFAVTAPTVYLYAKFAHFNVIGELCCGVVLAHAVFLGAVSIMSSGREMLSGTTTLVLAYLSRLRASFQRATA